MAKKPSTFQVQLRPDTSPDRVKGYKYGTYDWQGEYDMLLPDGITCADCIHLRRCTTLFSGKPENTSCDFNPSRFQLAKKIN